MKRVIISAWRTAAWSATASNGKLRPLNTIMREIFPPARGAKESREERLARVRAMDGYAERHNKRVRAQGAAKHGRK